MEVTGLADSMVHCRGAVCVRVLTPDDLQLSARLTPPICCVMRPIHPWARWYGTTWWPPVQVLTVVVVTELR